MTQDTVINTATVVVAKNAVPTTVYGAVLMFTNDVEFIILLFIGIFASITSYFYDWVHREERKFSFKEVSEVMKYTFYGIVMMFTIYYVGINHLSEYLEFPKTVWGMIAAISAGSAINIIEYSFPLIGDLLIKLLVKAK